jgi:ppGpp synthetase/RelA/SpoT-type nucleotidyltranferase
MNIEELHRRIKQTKSIKDKLERLSELRDVAEEVANHFTESMSFLETEIEFVLERTPQKVKDELGYNDVHDLTRDINPRSSCDY